MRCVRSAPRRSAGLAADAVADRRGDAEDEQHVPDAADRRVAGFGEQRGEIGVDREGAGDGERQHGERHQDLGAAHDRHALGERRDVARQVLGMPAMSPPAPASDRTAMMRKTVRQPP